jgi:hypothetical protein
MVATYGCVAGETTRTADSTSCGDGWVLAPATGEVAAVACVVATVVAAGGAGFVVDATPGGCFCGYSLKMRICQPNITAKEININVIRRLVSIKSRISNF